MDPGPVFKRRLTPPFVTTRLFYHIRSRDVNRSLSYFETASELFTTEHAETRFAGHGRQFEKSPSGPALAILPHHTNHMETGSSIVDEDFGS